jgi:hypothetical protein
VVKKEENQLSFFASLFSLTIRTLEKESVEEDR